MRVVIKHVSVACILSAVLLAARFSQADAHPTATASPEYAAQRSAPPNVIFSTDMWSDIDDALALAMLHALHERREINLVGGDCERR